MEPHATVAVWEAADKLTLYDATQGVMNTRAVAAYFLNLKPENVRVIARYIGGGFGSKGQWTHDLLAAMAANLLLTLVALLAAGPLMRMLGQRIEAVITRLLGVLLAALAVQFVIDGLQSQLG